MICKLKKSDHWDPVYLYILIAAVISFLEIAFLSKMELLYELVLVIPCMLALGVLQGRGINPEHRKIFLLPGLMAAWHIVVQLKHGVDFARVYSAGLFFSAYLFAFPLATLLRDGDKKKALKMFAGAYLAAAIVLAMTGMLLIFDCQPGFLSDAAGWDGTRLWIYWHSNSMACLLLIGIIFAATILAQAKSPWIKAGLLLAMIMMATVMALTNCRTVILVTGGFLGATLFFALIKHGKKWFIPGVLAAGILAAAFFAGANSLYQANSDRLERKYLQQETLQVKPESEKQVIADGEKAIVEIAEEEETPLSAEPSKTKKKLTTSSPQGTLAEDLGSLNGRTKIWKWAMEAIRNRRSILLWGVGNPGGYVSAGYGTYKFPHLHNAWIECLMGMGLFGLLGALAFTLITAWNGLIVLLKYHQDVWKRNVALLSLCLMAISMLEAYLFYTKQTYTVFNMLFFLCAGYLVHWQEEDNRRMLAAVYSRLPFGKKR